MLRWIGALLALGGISMIAAWSVAAGSDPVKAATFDLPFAGLGVVLAGIFTWMAGMARRETCEAAEWARVGSLVGKARAQLFVDGELPLVPIPPEATQDPVVAVRSPRVEALRRDNPARKGPEPQPPAPEPVRVRPEPERVRPAPIREPVFPEPIRIRPRTAAARAAGAQAG